VLPDDRARELLERGSGDVELGAPAHGSTIGAVLPEEIAVAIVAEAIHYRRVCFKHPLSKKLYQTVQS